MVYTRRDEQSVLEVNVLDAEKMSERNDLSDFDMGQMLILKQLGQSIFKMTGIV